MKQKDILLKTYLSDGERYADLWNTYLGKEVFRGDGFEAMETSGIQKDVSQKQIRKLEHDLLKKYQTKENLCILGVENQETVDYRMVIRSMGYGLEVLFRQIRELEAEHQQAGDLGTKEYLSKIKKEDRLVPVAILVVYFGKSPWNGARNLYELLDLQDIPESLKKMIPDYKMNLLDIQRFPHIERFQTDLFLVFGFLQRRWSKQGLRNFIQENRERFQNLREDAYDVIQAYGNIPILKKVKENYKTELGGYNMCQAWDEMMAEERMKGKREGKKEGEERMACLIEVLTEENQMDKIRKVIQNRTYRKKMYKELGI